MLRTATNLQCSDGMSARIPGEAAGKQSAVPPETAAAPDDPRVGKFLILGVVLVFVGVLRLSTADFENVSIPFMSPAVAANPALISAEALGTPAAVSLPESDPATWFSGSTAADGSADVPWDDIQEFLAAASTPGGWAEACKSLATAAGTDRSANPPLGALACSDDPTVTELQRFAVELLAAQSEVALFLRGANGHDAGAVAGRLAEVRHSCANGLPSRQAGAESAYLVACEMSLEPLNLPGDAEALQIALGEAYGLVALDLAVRDPEIDAEPPAIASKDAADTAADGGADNATADATATSAGGS